MSIYSEICLLKLSLKNSYSWKVLSFSTCNQVQVKYAVQWSTQVTFWAFILSHNLGLKKQRTNHKKQALNCKGNSLAK